MANQLRDFMMKRIVLCQQECSLRFYEILFEILRNNLIAFSNLEKIVKTTSIFQKPHLSFTSDDIL